MNILYTIDAKYARAGGVSTFLQGLLSHLSEEFDAYDWSLTRGVRIGQVRQHGLGISAWRKYRAMRAITRFRGLLRKSEADLVHLNPSLGRSSVSRDVAFARRAYNAGVPFIVFIHGWNKQYAASLRPDDVRRLCEAFGRARKIVVLAGEFKDKLIEWGFDPGKIIVETTMVEDSLVAGQDAVPQRGGTSGREFRMLFLSRIVREKGIYETLDVLQELRRRSLQVSLTVAGDGPELDDVKAYARREGLDVRFAGFVTGASKRQVYLESDMFLFPSSYGEGLPISVLEAMAFGLPVITRPVGGLRDIFVDGKMGFVTESLEPRVLASLVERLLEDVELRQGMAAYNHDYARRHLLASQVTRRIENIYRSAVTNGRE